MMDFSPIEWRQFTIQEQRIILMLRQYKMEKEEIMANLRWPLTPMSEVTWRGHYARLMKKMSAIRLNRQTEGVYLVPFGKVHNHTEQETS